MARISKNQVGALAKARTPAQFEPPNRRRLSGPGLRTFLNIADLWSLTDQQCRLILGFPSRATYRNSVLAAADYNFRRLIRWLRILLWQILSALFAEPAINPA
jgi:hypothetical protein